MNGIIKQGDTRMTVKEVAEALGYQPDTIQGKVKELFPSLVKNGVASRLTMTEIDIIKQNLTPRNLGLKSEVENAVMDIEMRRKAAEVMAWLIRDNEQLKAKNAELEPKGESFDALQRSSNTMSISNCAKHFGLHPKTEVYAYLRERGYLTTKDLPSQAAIDSDILSLIQNVVKSTGITYSQAVVRVNQLEAWRLRVVPQIKKWASK